METKKPEISIDLISTEFESRFIKVFGMEYVEGRKYINASRREKADLVALKEEDAFREMLPDAVSCIVILDDENAEEDQKEAGPRILMNYEFRYPIGQFLLSVPAGLIDKKDQEEQNPILSAARRELKEETNIELTAEDKLKLVNPLLFSTPGMTDESNALVCAVIKNGTGLNVNQDGAEGTECFDGYVALTKEDAKRILKAGRDDKGIFYSVYTWAGLMYFVSDMWKE